MSPGGLAEAGPLTVMLVAAEASGDALGAKLARALRERLGADKVRFVGVGGAKMAAEGVESPFDIAQLSILGIVESLKAYPRAMARLKDTLALAAREKPDVAVLIDSWGFNIRLAKALRKQDPGLPLVKYVAPQVWAYHAGAPRTWPAAVDLLLSIQPMDKPFFDAVDLPSVFVGNSALAHDFSQADPGPAARRDRRRARRADPAGAARQPSVRDPAGHAAVRGRRAPPEGPAAGPARRRARRLDRGGVGQGPRRGLAVPGPCHRGRGAEGRRHGRRHGRPGLQRHGDHRTGPGRLPDGGRLRHRQDHLRPAEIDVQAALGDPVQHRRRRHGRARAAAGRLHGPGPGRRGRSAAGRPALRAAQVAAQNAALDKMGRGMPDPSEAAASALLDFLKARGTVV
jgi:lipid-A-disaccharide synthase